MSKPPRLTKEQAAIIGAFTGISTGPFSVIHEYAERVLGGPIWTHEFADKKLMKELKEAAREDFIALCFEQPAPPEPALIVDETAGRG